MFSFLKKGRKIIDVLTDQDVNTAEGNAIAAANASVRVAEEQTLQKGIENSAKVIVAEANGKDALQRLWRPSLMVLFGLIIAFDFLVFPIINFLNELFVSAFLEEGTIAIILKMPEIPAALWDLIKIGVGGYIVGRSAEKIVDNRYNKRNSDKLNG